MATSYNLIHDRIDHDLTFLSIEPAGESAPAEPPLVIILHGLRSDKESVLEPCYQFARQGFRAVAPDLRLHGERDHADTRDARLQEAYVPTMLAMIEKSVEDIASLITHFGAKKAAVHGISMGGIVAFPAMLADPRLTVAAIAMGSPDWAGMLETMGVPKNHPQFPLVEAYSPLSHAASFPPRALLMLHGDIDETVRIDGVRKLRDTLRPLYEQSPDRLDLVEYQDLGHVYTDDMIRRSVDWVERYL